VLAAYTQLRLARAVAYDQRLPVGAAPTPTAAITATGPQGISATSGRARLAGEDAEILWPLPRPAQGSLFGPATRFPAVKKYTKKPREKQIRTAEGRLTGPTGI
jgi:hypothetical protein